MKINENLLIEIFQEKDLGSTMEVFKTTIPYAFKLDGVGHLLEMIDHEIDEKRKLLTDTITGDLQGQIFLIAKYQGETIGVIGYGPSGRAINICSEGKLANVGELGSLYVLPQHHNNGIGGTLIHEMMKHLDSIGIEDFCLDSGFEAAQKRWTKKFGKPYIVVKDYWAEGADNMVWYCKVRDFI